MAGTTYTTVHGVKAVAKTEPKQINPNGAWNQEIVILMDDGHKLSITLFTDNPMTLSSIRFTPEKSCVRLTDGGKVRFF